MGDLLQFLWEFCPSTHGYGSVFWHKEQLQELRAGDDRVGGGGAPDRAPHPVHVPGDRLPRDVHHHRPVLRRGGAPDPPVPRLPLAKEDSGATAAKSGKDLS